ncbi:Fe-S cluster assembly ATPase SufC [Candidatus Peregrinibacteria bacterium]|nr:Fe-S cluster assembly ATPase SufC [Candidatus Peregrinibacteria bacterium]
MFFNVKNLSVEVQNKPILKGLSLTVKAGEIHAIMGPNGSGKSTLTNAIAGHPKYKVTAGDIIFNGVSIKDLAPHKRAQRGIFAAFQSPQTITGVSVYDFLKTALMSIKSSRGEKIPSPVELRKFLREKIEEAGLEAETLYRNVNEGFSGGEKKKLEIAQMAVLEPSLAILDEIDSGLDIDALKNISELIKRFASKKRGIILITHHQRILEYVKPNFIHIMVCGKIVKSGDDRLSRRLELKGYKEFKIQSSKFKVQNPKFK